MTFSFLKSHKVLGSPEPYSHTASCITKLKVPVVDFSHQPWTNALNYSLGMLNIAKEFYISLIL